MMDMCRLVLSRGGYDADAIYILCVIVVLFWVSFIVFKMWRSIE